MNIIWGVLFVDCIQKYEELFKFYYVQCDYDMKKCIIQVNMEVLCDIVFVFFCYCIFSGLFVFWYNDSVYINCCGMWNFELKFKLNLD